MNGSSPCSAKKHFEKAYMINWSDKVYRIKQVLATRPVTYTVENDRRGQHKDTFYQQELQKVKAKEFRIQKILKYKTENRKKYAFVKWIDYDSSYNSWVPVEDLI